MQKMKNVKYVKNIRKCKDIKKNKQHKKHKNVKIGWPYITDIYFQTNFVKNLEM